MTAVTTTMPPAKQPDSEAMNVPWLLRAEYIVAPAPTIVATAMMPVRAT